MERMFGIAVSGPVIIALGIPLMSNLTLLVGFLAAVCVIGSRMTTRRVWLIVAFYSLIGLHWAFLMQLTAYIDRVGPAH